MSNTSGANFLSVKTSPSNWAMNQAVHLNKEGSRGSARGMMVVSGLFGPISSGKNLACFAAKAPLLPIGIAGLTMKDVSSIKDKKWTKLEVLKQVVINTGRALLELAVHIYKCVMFLTFSPLCCLTVGMISPEAAKKAHDWLKLTHQESSDLKKSPAVEPKPNQQAEPKPNPQVVVIPEVPPAQPLPEVVDNNNPPEQNNAQLEDQQASPDLGNQGNEPAPKKEEQKDNPPVSENTPPPLPTGFLSPRKIEASDDNAAKKDESKTDSNKEPTASESDSSQATKSAAQLAAEAARARLVNEEKLKRLSKDIRTRKAQDKLDEAKNKVEDNPVLKFVQENQSEESGEEEEDDPNWRNSLPQTTIPAVPEVPASDKSVQSESVPPVTKKQEPTQRALPPIPANPPAAAQPKLSDRPLPVPGLAKEPSTPLKSDPKASGSSPESPNGDNSPAEGQGKSKKAQQRRKKAAAKAAGNGSPEPKPVAKDAPIQLVPQQSAQVPAQQPAVKPVVAEPAQAKVPAQAPSKAPSKAPANVIPKPGSKWAAKVVLAPGAEEVKDNLSKSTPKGMGKGTIEMKRAKLLNRRTQMYSDETVKGAGIGTDDDDDETVVIEKHKRTHTPVSQIFPQQN